jgi:hypothetical protein
MKEILHKLFYEKDVYHSSEEVSLNNNFEFMPKLKNFDEYRESKKELIKRLHGKKVNFDINDAINQREPYVYFRPYTYEQLENIVLPSGDCIFNLIDNKFYNKKFIVDDYVIHVHHSRKVKPLDISEATDEWKKNPKKDYIYGGHCITEEWCIILEYHGVFKKLGSVQLYDSIDIKYLSNKYFGNWWLNYKDYDDSERYILNEHIKSLRYDNFNSLLFKLFKKCDNTIELTDSDIEHQSYYDCDVKKYHNPDYEWFIKQELNNNIYKPTTPIIKYVYLEDDYSFKYKKPDKNLLSNLGTKTVQLSATEHFPVASFFELNGINIKAPKSVITHYKYEKYINDDKMLSSIKKDKETKKRHEELVKYNDTFTLSFHGKEILINTSSQDIIQYLENKEKKDTEQIILDNFKIIFDKFKDVSYFELASFGTHFAYELAGEKHYNDEKENSHIPEETLAQIHELYSENIIIPSEEYLELKYGRIERGAILIGVRRNGKDIEIYTEDYDISL